MLRTTLYHQKIMVTRGGAVFSGSGGLVILFSSAPFAPRPPRLPSRDCLASVPRLPPRGRRALSLSRDGSANSEQQHMRHGSGIEPLYFPTACDKIETVKDLTGNAVIHSAIML